MASYATVAEEILSAIADQKDLKKGEHLDIAVVLCDGKGRPKKYRPESDCVERCVLPGHDVSSDYSETPQLSAEALASYLERVTGGHKIIGFKCLPGDNRKAANSYGGEYTICALYLNEADLGNLDGFLTLDEISQLDNVDLERVMSAFKLARDIAPALKFGYKS